jgi:hypothetical protein
MAFITGYSTVSVGARRRVVAIRAVAGATRRSVLIGACRTDERQLDLEHLLGHVGDIVYFV